MLVQTLVHLLFLHMRVITWNGLTRLILYSYERYNLWIALNDLSLDLVLLLVTTQYLYPYLRELKIQDYYPFLQYPAFPERVPMSVSSFYCHMPVLLVNALLARK